MYYNSDKKLIDRAITDNVEIPEEIQALAAQATHDLYFGPNANFGEEEEEEEDDYPGFTSACHQVSTWLNDNVSGCYVCLESGCISDREPEGQWVDDDYEPCDPPMDEDDREGKHFDEPMPYAEVSRRDIAGILFGKLAEYL